MGLFDLGATFKPRTVAGVKGSRFIEPHDTGDIPEHLVKYANADELAQSLGACDTRTFVLLDGTFIFGDMIEALIVRNDWDCIELTISTLSMSQENIDSLANLVNGGFVRALNLVISSFFFSHERHTLMPYLYEQLDVNDTLQVAVASVHTKIVMIKTACGRTITIHGSANLRTSSNIEQIAIDPSPALFAFCADVHHAIIAKHKTINKQVRRTDLWQAVLAGSQALTPESKPASRSEPQPSCAAPSASANQLRDAAF